MMTRKFGLEMENMGNEPASYQRGTVAPNFANAIKMSSNENPLARDWLSKKIQIISGHDHSRYPNDSYPRLKYLIAQKEGVSEEQVFIANGSSEALALIARAFLRPNHILIQSALTFPLFKINAQLCGTKTHPCDMINYKHSIPKMLEAVKIGRSVVYVDNPCNPTGSILSSAEISNLIKSLRDRALIIIDEAYDGLVTHADYESAVALAKSEPHVIVVKTLSKNYGLAGARLGYLIADSDIVKNIENFRSPFNVSSISAALAAEVLEDREFPKFSADFVCREMGYMIEDPIIKSHLICRPHANYFCLKFADAAAIENSLLEKGISIKRMRDDHSLVRVSLGLESHNQKFRHVLRKILRGGRSNEA